MASGKEPISLTLFSVLLFLLTIAWAVKAAAVQRHNEVTASTNSWLLPPKRIWSESENLTAAEKCRLEGLGGLLPCELEYEDPDTAYMVYRKILPRLYAMEIEDDNETLQGIEVGGAGVTTPRRDKRAIRKLLRNPVHVTRQKREAPGRYDLEVCETSYRIARFYSTRHAVNGQRVTTYFYRGDRPNYNPLYVQLFEIGECPLNTKPLIRVRVVNAEQPKCKTASIKVLANFVIDLTSQNISDFSRCVRWGETAAICRDWVVTPSQCKLYFRLGSTGN